MSDMRTIGQRIRHLRAINGLSQEELAAMLDISRGAVGNWEHDKGISRDNLNRLAEKFGCSLEWLANNRGDPPAPGLSAKPPPSDGVPSSTDSALTPNASEPFPFVLPSKKLPIYGRAVGGGDGRMVFNGEKLGEVFAIPALANVPNAYALYVSGESMEPRYFAGEVLYVHPTRPPARGDHVVVEVQPDNEGEPPYGFVKRYVRWNGKELILEQYNPPEEIRIPAEKVVRVNVIMGSGAG